MEYLQTTKQALICHLVQTKWSRVVPAFRQPQLLEQVALPFFTATMKPIPQQRVAQRKQDFESWSTTKPVGIHHFSRLSPFLTGQPGPIYLDCTTPTGRSSWTASNMIEKGQRTRWAQNLRQVSGRGTCLTWILLLPHLYTVAPTMAMRLQSWITRGLRGGVEWSGVECIIGPFNDLIMLFRHKRKEKSSSPLISVIRNWGHKVVQNYDYLHFKQYNSKVKWKWNFRSQLKFPFKLNKRHKILLTCLKRMIKKDWCCSWW